MCYLWRANPGFCKAVRSLLRNIINATTRRVIWKDAYMLGKIENVTDISLIENTTAQLTPNP